MKPAKVNFAREARVLISIVMISLLAACAGTLPVKSTPSARLPTPNPHAKIGSPYTINGVTYVPKADPDYVEVGIASWYGPQFHGKLTANGELFDQQRLSAAHKTLPLPSLVRVTNLENGRSAVVRVNDRGPFAGDRIIDLSMGAAEMLGTKQQGLARVRVEYLGAARLSDAITTIGAPENYAALHVPMEDIGAPPRVAATPAPPPALGALKRSVRPSVLAAATTASAPTGYYVLVGSYSDAIAVREIRDRLPPVIPVHVTSDGAGQGVVHHVKLGPYRHEFAAIEAQRVAQMQGFGDAHIVHEAYAQ